MSKSFSFFPDQHSIINTQAGVFKTHWNVITQLLAIIVNNFVKTSISGTRLGSEKLQFYVNFALAKGPIEYWLWNIVLGFSLHKVFLRIVVITL